MSLPRNPSQNLASQICADCSAPEPQWASVNRGVLICTECCTAHRSLGRHVSMVQSVQRSNWHPQRLAMLHTLHSNGANNIWEHSLLDPKHPQANPAVVQWRKPRASDTLYPTKSDFIRAKYDGLSFVLRPAPGPHDSAIQDLNRQLHSCVRTKHLETTLRLLALGANPNFADPERNGTTPMHVAARELQALQVELLAVYGGDPCAVDGGGLQPSDYAAQTKDPQGDYIVNRLMELSFEATDRLSLFLCGKTPDHHSGQHFVIPELSTYSGLDARLTRGRLAAAGESQFTKLIQDVLDEIDRREVDASWSATAAAGPPSRCPVYDRYIVPFLPVNPALSVVRNQYRQKLAKLSAREFAALAVDILAEAKRRSVVGAGKRLQSSKSQESLASEGSGPVYDEVPMEENGRAQKAQSLGNETMSLRSIDISTSVTSPTAHNGVDENENTIAEKHPNNDSVVSSKTDLQLDHPLVAVEDYEELKEQLHRAEDKIERLTAVNESVQIQMRQLQVLVEGVHTENADLREVMRNTSAAPTVSHANTQPAPAPLSPRHRRDIHRTVAESYYSVHSAAANGQALANSAPSGSQYRIINDAIRNQQTSPTTLAQLLCNGASSVSPKPDIRADSASDEHPPHVAEAITHTEDLIASIRQLHYSAQYGLVERFPSHARDVNTIVGLMSTLRLTERVPPNRSANVASTLESLHGWARALESVCATTPTKHESEEIEAYACRVVQAAYDVAKCAKVLMQHVQTDEN